MPTGGWREPLSHHQNLTAVPRRLVVQSGERSSVGRKVAVFFTGLLRCPVPSHVTSERYSPSSSFAPVSPFTRSALRALSTDVLGSCFPDAAPPRPDRRELGIHLHLCSKTFRAEECGIREGLRHSGVLGAMVKWDGLEVTVKPPQKSVGGPRASLRKLGVTCLFTGGSEPSMADESFGARVTVLPVTWGLESTVRCVLPAEWPAVCGHI